MAILKKEDQPYKRREIDISGPDGNEFVLMAYARNYANQIWGEETTEEIELDRALVEAHRELYNEEYKVASNMGKHITNQMMESDYEHALQVFDHYFGSFVDLIR